VRIWRVYVCGAYVSSGQKDVVDQPCVSYQRCDGNERGAGDFEYRIKCVWIDYFEIVKTDTGFLRHHSLSGCD
jgi:hypothetical protein